MRVKAFGYHSDHKKLKWIHNREKPNPSEECGKYFTNNSTLSNLHKIYNGEKHYKCERIDIAFKGTSLVNKSIGTEEQPHISKAYDEGFICHSALAEHERIHTWENLYKCAEYTYVFSCNLSLYKHERISPPEM